MNNDYLNLVYEMINNIIKELEKTLNNIYKEIMSVNVNKENIDTDTLTL